MDNFVIADFWLKWFQGYAAMFCMMPLENMGGHDIIGSRHCHTESSEFWDGVERMYVDCGKALDEDDSFIWGCRY